MSFLNAGDYNANDAAEKDVVGGGGFKALTSDVYDFVVNHAYFSQAKSGAKAVNLELEGTDGGKRRFTVYITNKNGEIKYKDKKTGELHYLPGFLTIDSLCLLTVGKPLVEIDKLTETKTIMLYNFEAKGEVATDVPMLMPLIKQKIKAAVLERIENKSVKNQSTGNYEPTNEKRTTNEIAKFFRERDDMTVSEIRARKDKATFINDWLDTWKGKPDDRFKPVEQAGTGGVPGGAFAGAGNAGSQEPAGTTAGQDNLFM